MLLRSALAILVASAALAGACAPSGAGLGPEALGTSTVDGTVGGTTLTTMSAVADFVPYFPPGNAPAVGELRVVLSDKANVCGTFHNASATYVDIRLQASTGVTLGTFPLVGAATTNGQAQATFVVSDGTCSDATSQMATGGTLTLKGAHFSGALLNVNGSIDATFPGGHLTGNFNANYCDDGQSDAQGGPDAGVACTP